MILVPFAGDQVFRSSCQRDQNPTTRKNISRSLSERWFITVPPRVFSEVRIRSSTIQLLWMRQYSCSMQFSGLVASCSTKVRALWVDKQDSDACVRQNSSHCGRFECSLLWWNVGRCIKTWPKSRSLCTIQEYWSRERHRKVNYSRVTKISAHLVNCHGHTNPILF